MVEFMDGFGDAGSIVGEGLFFGFEAEAFVLVSHDFNFGVGEGGRHKVRT